MNAEMLNIFDIQRFSWHDGPGIRTVVFFKGCNLHCFWCHNPESLSAASELLLYQEKCVRCGKCVAVCPHGCHHLSVSGGHEINREACTLCGKCTEACYADALKIAGRSLGIGEVMAEVLKDREFYELSGGGVTLSGGEPLLQVAGCEALLVKCRQAGIHTAVDTAGDVPWGSFERILAVTDLFLYDLKTLNPELHREACGAPNGRILENLRALGACCARIVIRIPVIPGFNDNPQEMASLAGFLRDIPRIEKVELLPFHTFGSIKYRALGVDYPAGRLGLISEESPGFIELRQKFKEINDKVGR